LLSPLHPGIKEIRSGPTLTAFITPIVRDAPVKTFGSKPIATVDEDMKAILGGTAGDITGKTAAQAPDFEAPPMAS